MIYKKKKEYISWLFLNIFMPLLPLFIKGIITIFTTEEISIEITVLESTELLFYALFTNTLLLNLILENSNISIAEFLMQYCIIAIQLVIIVLITLNYLRVANSILWRFGCGLTLLCPIVTAYFKYRTCNNKDD